MLILLIKTRLLYYLNFIRCHFSRRLLIELGFLFGFGLYLVIRSPADIGFQVNGIFSQAYSAERLERWFGLLWLFYILAEASAYLTLRPTADWNLLVGLPVSRHTFAGYYLLRFFSKIFIILLIGVLPFLGGSQIVILRLLIFSLAGVFLVALALISFSQASRLRRRKWRWLLIETGLFTLLINAPGIFQKIRTSQIWSPSIGFVIVLVLAGLLFWRISRTFHPGHFSYYSRQGLFRPTKSLWRFFDSGNLVVFINDFYFLLRKKRGVFGILLLETFVISASVVSQTEMTAAFVSSIFIQVFFSWLLVLNFLVSLFERDARTIQIIKTLPLKTSQVWFGRWLLAAVFCAVPLVIPILLILVKFPFGSQFFGFSAGVLIAIPAVLATIYCNTGFALFPQAKMATYLMNFSILLVILFWFYMPFGSFFILAIILFWIRKSQKHFKQVEIL